MIAELTNKNLEKKLEFEGKLLDCLTKILDDASKEKKRVHDPTLQMMINYIEVRKL